MGIIITLLILMVVVIAFLCSALSSANKSLEIESDEIAKLIRKDRK
jgi:Na+-transporting methylmalonyl-CoA/oxaloacetate decarboxylase gamma subunit